MRHLRQDYDSIQPWPVKRDHWVKDSDGVLTKLHHVDEEELSKFTPIIEDDEPVFLLRAKDPVAARVVRNWTARVDAAGGDPLLVTRVREWADEMDKWREEHYPEKQYPDTPDNLLC